MKKRIFRHEGKDFPVVDRDFEEYHGVTLITTTLNEEEYIEDFIKHFRPFVKRIVLVDGGSVDRTLNIATPLVDCVKSVPYTGSHGNMLNHAMMLSYTDWTMLIDPDERLTEKLLNSIKSLIDTDEYDCYSFPRREYLNDKVVEGVYPDYQERLFRTYCRFVRPIHQELVGYKKKMMLPMDQGLDMIHSKKVSRHAARNIGYKCFETHLKHEIGEPGCQLKDSFKKRYPELTFDNIRDNV